MLNQLCEVQMMNATSNICKVNLVIKGDNTTMDFMAELLKKGLAVESTTASNHTPPRAGRSPPANLAIRFPNQEVADIQIRDGSSPSSSVKVLPKLPLPSGEFQAVVVFVNHPGSFYIHIASTDNAHVITKLGADLNSYYSQPNRESCKPKTGELCAAQFSQDNGWYRAVAVKQVSDSVAKVMFVDFGNEEKIGCNAIRKLSEEFIKVPVLALHCSLAGAQPSGDQGGQWSSEVTKYMMSKVIIGEE